MSQTEQDVVVLVADDEPSTLALVASHVRSRGYKVLEASDGDQAWQLAHEHLPDLVILDVMMPGMSGWEVCRKIREAVSLAHTGVIMLTGIGENLNEMTSPLYGADAYLDKPFEFAELDAKVTSTLAERREGAMGRPHPEATERRASEPPTAGANGMSTMLAAPVAKRRGRAAKAASEEPADSGATPTQRLTLSRPTKKLTAAQSRAAVKKSEQPSSKKQKAGKPTTKVAGTKSAAKTMPAAKAKGAKPKAAKKPAKVAAKSKVSAGKKGRAKAAPARAKASSAKSKAAKSKSKSKASGAKAKSKVAPAKTKAKAAAAKAKPAAKAPAPKKAAKSAAAKRRANAASSKERSPGAAPA
jgi:DNA-binding response OmpR family regulator